MDVIARWRAFEAALHARGLGWALRYAPADLRWVRDEEHCWGARVDHLLPPDYLAFVAEVGYPVIAPAYFSRAGLSFLPPEPMAAMSPFISDEEDEFPEPVHGKPTVCRHAFFAGYDLPEFCGFALAADGVWLVEDGGPVEHVGSFTHWLLEEITKQQARIADIDAERAAQLLEEDDDEDEDEDDPHGLLDYHLGQTFDQPPYSAVDLQLHWVMHGPLAEGGTRPFYGLIDTEGRWRIPLGKKFRRVRPFRAGVAEVILNNASSDDKGPWRRIDVDGHLIDESNR